MYEAFYNLKSNPFRLNPDPNFFYNSKTHKRALAYLRYGIEQGEGFIIITGDVGTGKTTLVSRLFQSLDTSNIKVARIVNTQLRAEDLLRMVSAEFGLDYKRSNKATMLKQLESFFIQCYKDNQRVLLIVDEAQNLAPKAIEELRMLSNIQYEGKQLLQSFLLGQKEFRDTMRMEGFEQLRQRVIASYHLRPLDVEETRQYILHRLHIVDWKNDPEFEPEVYEEIHRYAQGIPRKTNLLCDRILLYGGLEEIHKITYESLQSVLSDIQDEFWKNDMSVDINFDDPPESSQDMVTYKTTSPAVHKHSVEGEVTLDDIYRRISILDNYMHSLNDIVKNELKEIRRHLNKRDN